MPTFKLMCRHTPSALAVRWEATLRGLEAQRFFSLKDVAEMSEVAETGGCLVSSRPARLYGETMSQVGVG